MRTGDLYSRNLDAWYVVYKEILVRHMELIHKQPPDRSRQVMSRAFWLTVGQQEEIWKRFLSSSRSFLKTRKRNKGDLATGLVRSREKKEEI